MSRKRKTKATPAGQDTTTSPPKPYNVFAAICAYEKSELTYDDVVTMFQYLVDTGLAWKLQGHYGRVAAILLRCGDILAPVALCPDCGVPRHSSNLETVHRSCAGYAEYAKQKGIIK